MLIWWCRTNASLQEMEFSRGLSLGCHSLSGHSRSSRLESTSYRHTNRIVDGSILSMIQVSIIASITLSKMLRTSYICKSILHWLTPCSISVNLLSKSRTPSFSGNIYIRWTYMHQIYIAIVSVFVPILRNSSTIPQNTNQPSKFLTCLGLVTLPAHDILTAKTLLCRILLKSDTHGSAMLSWILQ